MPQLVIIGTHQRICPVAIRERLAFSQAEIRSALTGLRAYADEGLIISTCNRVEIGGLVADGQDGPATLIGFLADRHHIPAEQLTPHLYAFSGAEAVRHLFRLAAGLDSMVLGEEQIQTQLKGALADSQATDMAGQATARLLQHALAVGKLVRTETGIARQHLSVVSVALDIARERLAGLAGRRVLVVGAGRMAELALKHLRGTHAEIAIVNRTDDRVRALADAYGAKALPFASIELALAAADVVLSCTAAPGLVMTRAMRSAWPRSYCGLPAGQR